MEYLQFHQLLNDDLYTTFKGTYKDMPCVIKIYTEASDANNEFQVLEYLQEHSVRPEWFPKPYLTLNLTDKDYEWLPEMLDEHEIYKLIAYQYMPGKPYTKNNTSRDEVTRDLLEQLAEIHRLHLVHGDIKASNILLTPTRYLFIDYGRTFSTDKILFPPMAYMTEYGGEPPTQEDDFNYLLASI